jgi:hypothetical protein
VFDVVRGGDELAGELGCARLERGIANTGTARAPRVRLDGGQAQMVLLVRADDELDASYRGLSTVDVAAAQVPGLTLGELRSVAATSAVASDGASS